MVYAVMAQLAFSSAARRDAVLADVQGRIVGRGRWGAEELTADAFRFGGNGLRVQLRFQSNADAADLLARVQAFATGVRLPQPGSWLTVRTCTHDEGTNVCSETSRVTW